MDFWTAAAWMSIGLALVSAAVIAADEVRRPQKMAVMNVVWPLTALYFSVIAVVAYWKLGRTRQHAHQDGVTAAQVAVGTSHCGAGCMLADMVMEFTIAATGVVLFASAKITGMVLDTVLAWLVGIAFQFWAMRPMQPHKPAGEVVKAAMKADTLSIAAFQVGMFAVMALPWARWMGATGKWDAFDPRFWLAMQVAMVCGYATSFPMNAWLIRKGWKEAM